MGAAVTEVFSTNGPPQEQGTPARRPPAASDPTALPEGLGEVWPQISGATWHPLALPWGVAGDAAWGCWRGRVRDRSGVLLPLPPKGTLRGTGCLENRDKDRMRQMQPPAPPHCSALEGTLHPVPGSVHSDGGAGNSHIPECSLALRGIRYITALSWGVPSPPPSGGRCDPPEGVSSSPTLKGQLLAMSTLPSHPLVPRPGVVLVTAGGNGLTREVSPTCSKARGTIPCPWLVPRCRGAPRLQAGRREGQTDEGWTEGKEG